MTVTIVLTLPVCFLIIAFFLTFNVMFGTNILRNFPQLLSTINPVTLLLCYKPVPLCN